MPVGKDRRGVVGGKKSSAEVQLKAEGTNLMLWRAEKYLEGGPEAEEGRNVRMIISATRAKAMKTGCLDSRPAATRGEYRRMPNAGAVVGSWIGGQLKLQLKQSSRCDAVELCGPRVWCPWDCCLL